MNHSMMNHSSMNMPPMNHSSMNMPPMDHSSMNMPPMNHSGMNMGSMDMMKMYFNADMKIYLLFYPWFLSNNAKFIGAWFGVFIMAVLYEGFKVLREWLLVYSRPEPGSEYQLPNGSHENDKESPLTQIRQPKIHRISIVNRWHMLQSVLHMVQVTISYMLMLIFMTYNVYLCLAVVLGTGFGYFLFAWRRAFIQDINEHCH